MYIDYSGLWGLLAERGISKSELAELTGISSRVIAKLSKNETVTTETVARICEALGCDISKIMMCRNESELSFYEHFKRGLKLAESSNGFKIVRFLYTGQAFTVYFTQRRASRATHIHCRESGTVYWEQFYPFGGMSAPRSEESVLIKPTALGDERTVIVIKGKPGLITGLDEGIFISHKSSSKNSKAVYIMSEAAFKLFTPKKPE